MNGSADSIRSYLTRAEAARLSGAPVPDGIHTAFEALATLERALATYADARNWGISRDDLNYRVVSWIGPGAEKDGMPDATQVAREALA